MIRRLRVSVTAFIMKATVCFRKPCSLLFLTVFRIRLSCTRLDSNQHKSSIACSGNLRCEHLFIALVHSVDNIVMHTFSSPSCLTRSVDYIVMHIFSSHLCLMRSVVSHVPRMSLTKPTGLPTTTYKAAGARLFALFSKSVFLF